MKKLMLVLVACLLLLTLTLSSALAVPSSIQAFKQMSLRTIDMVDDTFYAYSYDENCVYTWQIGMDAPEKLCQLPPPDYVENYDVLTAAQQEEAGAWVDKLVGSDGNIYGINYYAGRVGLITDRGIAWDSSIKLDTSLLFNDGALCWLPGIPLVHEGILYIPGQFNDNDYTKSLFYLDIAAINLQTGESRLYETQGIQSMCAYTPDKLLLLRSKATSDDGRFQLMLSELNLTTGEITDLPLQLPIANIGQVSIGGLAYDQSQNTIYYSDSNGVWVSSNGAPFEQSTIAPKVSITEANSAWLLSSGAYACWAGGALDIQDLATQQDASSILSIAAYPDNIYQAFTSAHPESLVIASNKEYSAADIAQLIQSGDTTDIFCVAVDGTFTSLKDRGYTADLSASQIISDHVATLYPNVQQVLTNQQGQVVAYPSRMYLSTWEVHQPTWQSFFGDVPVPATYGELFDYMIRYQNERNPQEDMALLDFYDYQQFTTNIINAYIQQYEVIGEPLSFDSPALLSALDKLALLNQTILETGMDAPDTGDILTTLFFTFGGNILYGTTGDYVSLPTFVFEADTSAVLPANMSVLMINPLSEKQDLARKYLECAALESTNQTLYYMIHANVSQPVENPRYNTWMEDSVKAQAELTQAIEKAKEEDDNAQVKDLELRLEEEMQNMETLSGYRWNISPTGLENYRSAAPTLGFFENSLYLTTSSDNLVASQIGDLVNRFCAGQLDAQGLLKELENKMQQVYLENR